MQKKDDLINENTELRARLSLAEKWMQREVASSVKKIREESLRKNQRKHFENTFESERLDMITRDIMEKYGDMLASAPKYTFERLIDAEIYWYTLQKYPTMDALPVVLAYQKILDAWIEERLISPWRETHTWLTSPASNQLEKDLENILTKNYTLSIGRLYQILEMIREESIASSLLENLTKAWKEQDQKLFDTLTSDIFFLPFSELMSREIFSKKRHEKKVTFSDARVIRETLVIGNENTPLLKVLFLYT